MAIQYKIKDGKKYVWDDFAKKWSFRGATPYYIEDGEYKDKLPNPIKGARVSQVPELANVLSAPYESALSAIPVGEAKNTMVEVPQPRGEEIKEPSAFEKVSSAISERGPNTVPSLSRVVGALGDVAMGAVGAVNEYTPWQQAKEIAELEKQNKETKAGISDYAGKVGEFAAGQKEFGKGVDTAEANLTKLRDEQQLNRERVQSLGSTMDAIKASNEAYQKNKEEIDRNHEEWMMKKAQLDKQAEVEKRISSIASQARHPWEPKNAKSPIVQMDEDIDRMANEMAGNVKKPEPVVLKPRPALETAPESMQTTQQRPRSYADEYARRYQQALSGQYGSTSSSTGGDI